MVHIAGVTSKSPERRGPQNELKGRKENKVEAFESVSLNDDVDIIASAIQSGDLKVTRKLYLDNGKVDEVKLEKAVLALAHSESNIAVIDSETIKDIEKIVYDLQSEAGPGGEFTQYADGLERIINQIEAIRTEKLEEVNEILNAKGEAAEISEPSLSEILKQANTLGFSELASMREKDIQGVMNSNEQLKAEIAQLQTKAKSFGQRLFGLFGGGAKAQIRTLEQQMAYNSEIISAVDRLKNAYVEANAPVSTDRARSTKSDEMRNRNTPRSTGSGKMAV